MKKEEKGGKEGKEKKEKIESYTKYETARIIAARALQLSMNAPILLKIPKEQLEAINYDVIRIAEMEFNEGILPITVRRPKPRKLQFVPIGRELGEIIEEKEPGVEEEKEKEKIEQVTETISEELEQVELEEKEEVEEEEEKEGYEAD
ncbi:MAG: DNA-directed RNA polymerase subunit K [Candidatus Pacearchaeota archaeon]